MNVIHCHCMFQDATPMLMSALFPSHPCQEGHIKDDHNATNLMFYVGNDQCGAIIQKLDFNKFADLKAVHMDSIGVAVVQHASLASKSPSSHKKQEACNGWNDNLCLLDSSQCHQLHVCNKCSKDGHKGPCEMVFNYFSHTLILWSPVDSSGPVARPDWLTPCPVQSSPVHWTLTGLQATFLSPVPVHWTLSPVIVHWIPLESSGVQ
ncbi:uncharacterized protein LACBIDRAFT_331524 [Laccaria bicolor S238N-H82]|uniref:Predicted protein n=1 Tax=Laccaria bicolor (strain S238N-H82 / ATCC MYA-4686) TaxID=486041 RepID=B0DPQ8_LACBS|nr:uncharacterized protein LACBIDRAFT_331524 [Laccaria bicolor S238N-H82]EDR03491.1 predicted protein [Laccaria bicolor S238N-H82]|eukprot:XP_001885947.1 predicted protein [Laccaria bicolor S238N-H82]